MNKKNIAILIPCLLIGGTEISTFETALAFSGLGFRVSVIVYFNEIDMAMVEKFRAANINVVFLNRIRQNGLISSFKLGMALKRALLAKFDIVWVQYMTPTLVPLIVGKLFSKKILACIHFSANHFNLTGKLRVKWMTIFWLDKMICVSQTTAKGFYSLSKISFYKNKVQVLPNCINVSGISKLKPCDWREERGWSPDVIIIGYIGRLEHIKGLDILLRALKTLDPSLPFELVVVGDGSEKNRLINLAKELAIYSRVHFVGKIPHEQIPQAIKGLDLVVMPSRDEGFGLSAIEAMALGVPVVASRVGALPEVVVEGVTGLLSESENPNDLAKNICTLLRNPHLRKTMGLAGIDHVIKKYDRVTYRKNIENLLIKIDIINKGLTH